MKKPKYLYHGSGTKLEYLTPQKPIGDDDPKHKIKAVYAASDKRFALAMSACRSSKTVHAFNNRNTHVQNIYKGWPDENATVYLYVLDSKDFKHNSGSEWISTKKIKPLRVEEYKVKDLRHLYRKSSKKELGEWLKDRGGWWSPEEKEIKLKKLYKRYIEGKYIYRSQSNEFTSKMMKRGLIPHDCPYKEIRPKLERLFNLVLKLEKEGYQMILDWKGVYPIGSKAVQVSRDDLDSPFIDFTSDYDQAVEFKDRFKGGALTSNIIEFIDGIDGFKIKLTKSQVKLLKELRAWANKKSRYKSVIVSVKSSSRVFEKAVFSARDQKKKKRLKSPLGSFENFKKVIKKNGIKEYLPYLKGKKIFYSRVISKIPAKEIGVIK
jgi:hypothetical protein